MAQQSYSNLCIRYFLIWLCLSIIIIQLSQALNDNSNEDNYHPIDRRNSKKVAQMLQQILRRGEMQVHPYRIHEFLHRLHRRQVND